MSHDPPSNPAPQAAALPSRLEPLADTARAYAHAATAANTNRAYAADWRDFLAWRARRGLEARPLADPETVGLYLAALASGDGVRRRSVSTIERRLSALVWNFAQRGLAFDGRDPYVATVLTGVRRTHARPPVQKEALLPEHLIAMPDALHHSNLRNRALLLLGFAGGLRRSEIVGLGCTAEDLLDGAGGDEFFDGGMLLTLRGKAGWLEVEIGRGSSERTCPVVALETGMRFARIAHGPLFRRVPGKTVGSERLNDRHAARLVKRSALVPESAPIFSVGRGRNGGMPLRPNSISVIFAHLPVLRGLSWNSCSAERLSFINSGSVRIPTALGPRRRAKGWPASLAIASRAHHYSPCPALPCCAPPSTSSASATS